MIRRTLILAAAIVVFATAVIVIMAILDIVTVSALRASLGKIVSITGVSAGAAVLVIVLVKLAMKE